MRVTDLTGQRFTRLLVLSRAENGKRGRARWLCQCDCGNQKVVTADNLRSGSIKSCKCLNRELARDRATKVPIALRFWDSVATASADECWPWQGELRSNGYGVCRVGARRHNAHRVAWSLHHGREPDLQILHHCDNPSCCNPAHLYEGTQAENIRDMVQAGRARNGRTGSLSPEREFATRGYRRA